MFKAVIELCMKEEKFLIKNEKKQLEKFPGKGGWTYISLGSFKIEKKLPFGMIRVSGTIDNLVITNVHLMPMGMKNMLLPVKAEIRKKLGKKEGDWISVTLSIDDNPIEVPEEFIECLKDEPIAYKKFVNLSESEKKKYVDDITKAKTEDIKIDRMASIINKLAR